MRVVVDASVIVKWLLADPGREPDAERATTLLASVAAGELEILQPFHWLAEVAAVLARLSLATVTDDVLMLRAMEIPTTDEAEVLRRACNLAIETQQHLFDTLYHAVALENADTVLVTADETYRRQVQNMGRIQALSDF